MKKVLFALAALSFWTNIYAGGYDGWEKSCEAGNFDDCNLLASLYFVDNPLDDIKKDPSKVEKYGTMACDNGKFKACFFVGLVYTEQGKYEQAKEMHKKSCDGNDDGGCLGLAEIYENGDPYTEIDIAKAIKYYKKGCDQLNSSNHCVHLAHVYIVNYNNLPQYRKYLNKAKNLAQKGCKKGNQEDCIILSRVKNL